MKFCEEPGQRLDEIPTSFPTAEPGADDLEIFVLVCSLMSTKESLYIFMHSCRSNWWRFKFEALVV
jgi:hypothetical protein